MPSKVWPRSAGPAKVWPESAETAAARQARTAEKAEKVRQLAIQSAILSAASRLPPGQ